MKFVPMFEAISKTSTLVLFITVTLLTQMEPNFAHAQGGSALSPALSPSIAVEDFRASRPVKGDVITGCKPETGHCVSITVPPSAKLSGIDRLSDIQRGDLIYVRAQRENGNNLVAVDVEVNVFHGFARILTVSANDLTLMPLDYHTLRPTADEATSTYGPQPTRGRVLGSARITSEGQYVSPEFLRAGMIVEVFGYKSPSSATVRINRLEIRTETGAPNSQ